MFWGYVCCLHRLRQLEAASDPPQSQEVASALRLLGRQGQQLKAVWEQRQQKLRDRLALQRFGQEVDSFIDTCAGHEAFLHQDNLGVRSWGSRTVILLPLEGAGLLGSRSQGGQESPEDELTSGLCTRRT